MGPRREASSVPACTASPEDCRIEEIVDADDGGNNDQTHPEATGGDACDNQTHDWMRGRGGEDRGWAGAASPQAGNADQARRPADFPRKAMGYVGPGALDFAAAPMDMDLSE